MGTGHSQVVADPSGTNLAGAESRRISLFSYSLVFPHSLIPLIGKSVGRTKRVNPKSRSRPILHELSVSGYYPIQYEKMEGIENALEVISSQNVQWSITEEVELE